MHRPDRGTGPGPTGATVVQARARSVGAARRAGVSQVLRFARHLDPATLWIATTDADTLVPRRWLSRQLRYASQSWKAWWAR